MVKNWGLTVYWASIMSFETVIGLEPLTMKLRHRAGELMCFSSSDVHENHLKDLLKQIPDPTPRIPESGWDGAFAFLTSTQDVRHCCCCCWFTVWASALRPLGQLSAVPPGWKEMAFGENSRGQFRAAYKLPGLYWYVTVKRPIWKSTLAIWLRWLKTIY